MAYELRREREFELGLTYQGPTAVLEFEFSFFFPRGADDLAVILDAALFSIDVLPIIQANYLSYTIESDRDPLPDRYRVKIMLAGETEESEGQIGPFPLPFAQGPQAFIAPLALISIAIAVGIALVFAAIAWRTYNLGPAAGIVGLLLAGGAVALGLYLVFGRKRGNASAR